MQLQSPFCNRTRKPSAKDTTYLAAEAATTNAFEAHAVASACHIGFTELGVVHPFPVNSSVW